MQQRDFANAEKELKSAIQLDAKNLTYWKDLASAAYLAGEYPTTLAILDRVGQSEPPTPGELFVRALCYDKLQQTKLALDAYGKFLQADQNQNSDQVWQAQLKKMLEKKR
jgi:Tfp pilus assembly protein PilF